MIASLYKQNATGVRSLSAPGVACCVHLPPHPPEIKLASPLVERENSFNPEIILDSGHLAEHNVSFWNKQTKMVACIIKYRPFNKVFNL